MSAEYRIIVEGPDGPLRAALAYHLHLALRGAQFDLPILPYQGDYHDRLEELRRQTRGKGTLRLVQRASFDDIDRVSALVVRADRDETTFALVSCQRTRKVTEAAQLQSRITTAVTRWVEDTPEGKVAYADSSEDYNVGDLVGDLGQPTLQKYLAEEGIQDLKIETCSALDPQYDWAYDYQLVEDGLLSHPGEKPHDAAEAPDEAPDA